MNPGKLNQRISVYHPVESVDSMGGRSVEFVNIGQRWANVAVPKARDAVLADQEADFRTHVVTVRENAQNPRKNDILEFACGLRLKVVCTRPDLANHCVYLDCVSDVE